MSDYIVIALTNALEGREADYNAWFTNTHIPEVMQIPGFNTVTRFEVAEAQRMPQPLPYYYMTIYEVHTEDLSAKLAELGQTVANGTPGTAGNSQARGIWVYRKMDTTAQYVRMAEAVLQNVADILPARPMEGFDARIVHGERMTSVTWTIEEGRELPVHAHPHEQFVHMLEGQMELTVGGEMKILRPGDVLVIPSNVPHGGRTLSPVRLIDTFTPVRRDMKVPEKPAAQ